MLSSAFLVPWQCSALSRSFVTLVGDEVDRSPFDRVSAIFALVINEMNPGSESILVSPNPRQRTRGEKQRVLRKMRTKWWENYKEKIMEFLLERASEDPRRNPHRWSVPFPHPKYFGDPGEEEGVPVLPSRFCVTQWCSGLSWDHCSLFFPHSMKSWLGSILSSLLHTPLPYNMG